MAASCAATRLFCASIIPPHREGMLFETIGVRPVRRSDFTDKILGNNIVVHAEPGRHHDHEDQRRNARDKNLPQARCSRDTRSINCRSAESDWYLSYATIEPNHSPTRGLRFFLLATLELRERRPSKSLYRFACAA